MGCTDLAYNSANENRLRVQNCRGYLLIFIKIVRTVTRKGTTSHPDETAGIKRLSPYAERHGITRGIGVRRPPGRLVATLYYEKKNANGAYRYFGR